MSHSTSKTDTDSTDDVAVKDDRLLVDQIETQLRAQHATPTTSLRNPEYMHAVKSCVAYLLRRGLNQPDAIATAKEIVDVAAERLMSVAIHQVATPLHRLAIEIAIERGVAGLAGHCVVVPSECVCPMRPAQSNRLAAPLRFGTWLSLVGGMLGIVRHSGASARSLVAAPTGRDS